MVGTGSLSSQWSKVNRWLELQSYLSDTYGITEISAPHDLKNRLLCGFLLSQCYNPEVDDELLSHLGELNQEELLVLVTVTVPRDITKMTVNLKGPIVINAAERKATQVIVEGDQYQVKFPIYDVLSANKKKAGE